MKFLKYIKNNIPLVVCIISFVFLNTFLICSSVRNTNNITNFFRIHVVAASDSILDQQVKLEVAKNVEEYIYDITKNMEIKSKTTIKNTIISNINTILSIANETLHAHNKDYSLVANVGNIYYDEKIYNTSLMESGVYDSLEIVLDTGKGQNWWSLIYPYSYECNIENTFDNKDITYNISTEEILNNNNIEIEFKIFEDLKCLLAKFFTKK